MPTSNWRPTNSNYVATVVAPLLGLTQEQSQAVQSLMDQGATLGDVAYVAQQNGMLTPRQAAILNDPSSGLGGLSSLLDGAMPLRNTPSGNAGYLDPTTGKFIVTDQQYIDSGADQSGANVMRALMLGGTALGAYDLGSLTGAAEPAAAESAATALPGTADWAGTVAPASGAVDLGPISAGIPNAPGMDWATGVGANGTNFVTDPLAVTSGAVAPAGVTSTVPGVYFAPSGATVNLANSGAATGATNLLSTGSTLTDAGGGMAPVTGVDGGAVTTGATGGATNAATTNGAGTTAATTGLPKGTGDIDWGKVLAGIVGAVGASNMADAYKETADKYMKMGQPSRDRYEASFAPGFSMMNDPGYADAMASVGKESAAAMSMHGNPADSPNAWKQTQLDVYNKVAYPALQGYRQTNASAGGLASFASAVPAADTAAVGAQQNIWNAGGSVANNLFSPPQSNSFDWQKFAKYMGWA